MKILLQAALLAIQILTPAYASFNAGETIRLAVENSWPPYSDSNGNGYSKEIVRAAFKASGVKTKFQALPYARVLSSVKKGDVTGGFNVTRQESTNAIFHFSHEPILKAHASLFVLPGSSLLKIKKTSELPDGVRIGLIRGYEYGDAYDKQSPRFKERRVLKQEQIIRMLLSKRIDCAIMFDDVANYTLSKLKIPPESIVKSFRNHTSDIYVAFNKKNPNSKIYGQKLDDGLNVIKENGTYTKILSGLKNHTK